MPLTLADGRLRVTVLTVEPANPAAITETELAAGFYASPMINKPDYRLSPTSSDTVPDQPLDKTGNAVTFGNSNYEGTMTILRFLDEHGEADTGDDLLWAAANTKGSRLWVVEREGPLATQPDAAGDEYEVYEVITDEPQKPSDRAGYIKRVVPLGVQNHVRGVVVGGSGEGEGE